MITIVDSFGKDNDGKITIECGRDKITGEGTTMPIYLSPHQEITVNNNGCYWPKNIAAKELIGSVDIQSIKNCIVKKIVKGQWSITPTANKFTLQITLSTWAEQTATVTIGEPPPSDSNTIK